MRYYHQEHNKVPEKKLSKIAQFFHTSNLIENIDDESDDYQAVAAWTEEQDWLRFHMNLRNLNEYCTAWVFRTYPVWVWWREWMHHNEIEWEVAYLFHKKNYPNKDSNFDDILKWHIAFEHMHPFGDGNWRVWRYLMALQCRKASCVTKMYSYFLDEDFNTMRKKYYNIF